eukprot:2149335-Pyramimonas_sp.AAC.1
MPQGYSRQPPSRKRSSKNSCRNRPLPALLSRLVVQAVLRLQLLQAALLPVQGEWTSTARTASSATS